MCVWFAVKLTFFPLSHNYLIPDLSILTAVPAFVLNRGWGKNRKAHLLLRYMTSLLILCFTEQKSCFANSFSGLLFFS